MRTAWLSYALHLAALPALAGASASGAQAKLEPRQFVARVDNPWFPLKPERCTWYLGEATAELDRNGRVMETVKGGDERAVLVSVLHEASSRQRVRSRRQDDGPIRR